MSFRKRLKYFLVHETNCTNEEAQNYIDEGKVKINNTVAADNPIVLETDTISIDNRIIQEGIRHQYILFYKPRGIETTHNQQIENSLASTFPELKNLFFAGRLDKDSEGLLFLTTNGKFAHELAHPHSKQEKEYFVRVDKPIDNSFKTKMESGVEIMGYKTQNCSVKIIDENTFCILLHEGKNRQIRRMCYKLGYIVLELKRTRIANWNIGELKPGEWKEVQL
jgi:23S rRNA pseudouridine2604 synthase